MSYYVTKKTNSKRTRINFLIFLFLSLFLFLGCAPETNDDDNKSGGKLTITPGEITLPIVFVGNSYTQDVKLINAGTIDIDIKNIQIKYTLKNGEVEPETSEFTLIGVESFPFALEKGKTISIGVKFSPLRAIKYDKVYLFIDSSAKIGKHTVIEIKTTDLYPKISVSPSSIRFSGVNPNSTDEKNIVIENTGSADLVIDAGKVYMDSRSEPTLTLEGEDFENSKNKEQIVICPMDSEDNCLKRFEFKIKFAPTGSSTKSGKILIVSNDLKSTTMIDSREIKGMTAINVSINMINCVLDIYPPENETVIDMGARNIDSEYIKDLMLKNNGTDICYIKGIEVIENVDSIFSLGDLPSFTHELNPREILMFKVKFTPLTVAAYSAKLKLESNDASWTDGIKEIPINGEGVTP